MYNILPEKVWGYSDGRNVFISRSVFIRNDDNSFVDVNFLGRLCLIHYLRVIHNNVQANTAGATPRGKLEEFILNTKDGEVYKATLRNLKMVIADDAELLNEFNNYKGDKSIKLYVFLKKYNERNPLIFE